MGERQVRVESVVQKCKASLRVTRLEKPSNADLYRVPPAFDLTDYSFTSSTLLLSALPSSLSLLATGEVGPSPQALRRAALTEN
jgi:hypothetical protein